MSAPFVHTTALRTHAAELRRVSDQVDGAAANGRGTGLGFSTYGLIGEFFAGGARDAVAEASDAIAGIGAGIDRVADAVVAAAAAYDGTEDDNTVSFEVGAVSGDSWEGAGVVDSVHDTVSGITSGDFNAVDGATASIDVIGFIANPFTGLASAGIGWLMEHLWILEEPLNALAGDPDAITAASGLWSGSVKADLVAAQTDLASGVSRVAASWTFEAAAAYETVATQLEQSLSALAESCDGVSAAIECGGAMMAAVRAVIRDLIADFVSEVVVTFLAAAAASWFTLGGSVAAFIANAVFKATVLAGKITSKISTLVSKLADLLDRFSQLAVMVRRLRVLATRFDTMARDIGRSVGRNARTAEQAVADTAARARSAAAAYNASAPVRAASSADGFLGNTTSTPGSPVPVLNSSGVRVTATTDLAGEASEYHDNQEERARDDAQR